MVSCEAVNVVQVFPEGLHVLPGAQHRADLCPAVPNAHHILLTQEEVVGRYLTRHLDALLLGCADDQDLGEGKGRIDANSLHTSRTENMVLSLSYVSSDVLVLK